MIDPQKTIGFKIPIEKIELTYVDVCLYALAIGFSTDPYDDRDLRYTYERHEEFQIFPTLAPLFRKFDPFMIFSSCPGIPEFHPMSLLHGEQSTEVIKQLKLEAEYINESEIIDVQDKGKGAVISVAIKSYESVDGCIGDLALVNISKFYVRGLGGFGFKGKLMDHIPPIPKTNPTFEVIQNTMINQALIYRLNGDPNPLHIDMNMASIAGFSRPILHGLCQYGISAKLIVQTLCDHDASRLRQISVRFTSHVFPGDTLILRGWVLNTLVVFEMITKERGIPVIIGKAVLTPKSRV